MVRRDEQASSRVIFDVLYAMLFICKKKVISSSFHKVMYEMLRPGSRFLFSRSLTRIMKTLTGGGNGDSADVCLDSDTTATRTHTNSR